MAPFFRTSKTAGNSVLLENRNVHKGPKLTRIGRIHVGLEVLTAVVTLQTPERVQYSGNVWNTTLSLGSKSNPSGNQKSTRSSVQLVARMWHSSDESSPLKFSCLRLLISLLPSSPISPADIIRSEFRILYSSSHIRNNYFTGNFMSWKRVEIFPKRNSEKNVYLWKMNLVGVFLFTFLNIVIRLYRSSKSCIL
jgi:hypothetical protein